MPLSAHCFLRSLWFLIINKDNRAPASGILGAPSSFIMCFHPLFQIIRPSGVIRSVLTPDYVSIVVFFFCRTHCVLTHMFSFYPKPLSTNQCISCVPANVLPSAFYVSGYAAGASPAASPWTHFWIHYNKADRSRYFISKSRIFMRSHIRLCFTFRHLPLIIPSARLL